MPPLSRPDTLQRLARETFDLLVIGGGINGTAIARDAALRGLSVALVERDDFAAGTSSRSSRLIHGGVRYLEHGYLKLVFESSRERRILLRTAPHLVRPLEFTWPMYRGARIPRWQLLAGLWLYDLLALFRNVANHRRLSARGVLEREPALSPAGLKGGAMYFDARTNDTRLTLSNAIDAAELGAAVLNHAMATALLREGAGKGPATGVTGRDLLGGGEFTVRARCVVNAAGPWSDEVRSWDEPGHGAGVRGTKGAHIEVPRARVGNREAVTLVSPVDGRVMFVLPAGQHTIVGTTDTETAMLPGEVRATGGDVDYLLASVNGCFPGAKLTRDEVVSAWAGIRPLIASGNAGDPASASREHAIHVSTAGVVSISGGKLTTYRSMSAQVVDVVERQLGRTPSGCVTGERHLPGGDTADVSALEREASRTVGDAEVAEHLVAGHGTRWRNVWALVEADRSLGKRVAAPLPTIAAQLVYAAREEGACTLADLLVRRTHLAYELRDQARAIAPQVAALVAPVLGWTPAGVSAAVAEWEREAARLFAIEPG